MRIKSKLGMMDQSQKDTYLMILVLELNGMVVLEWVSQKINL